MRFNKEGNLLAVTTADNGFKILTNTDGLRNLRAMEMRSFDISKASTEMKVITLSLGYRLALIGNLVLIRFLLCCKFTYQVPSSAMLTSIIPVANKVERADRSSPSKPTLILVRDPDLTMKFA